MTGEQTNEAEAVALRAVGWLLADDARAHRFLALTGLTPATLRTGIGEDTVLAAALRFLEAYEPDLLGCADALDLPPAELVEARRRLER